MMRRFTPSISSSSSLVLCCRNLQKSSIAAAATTTPLLVTNFEYPTTTTTAKTSRKRLRILSCHPKIFDQAKNNNSSNLENTETPPPNSTTTPTSPSPSVTPPLKKGPKAKRSPSPLAKQFSSGQSSTTESQTSLLQEELTRLQQKIPIRKMSAALAEKKEHDKKMLAKGTEMLSNLPTITKVFDKLDPDTRRYIVVAAASEEWFGTPEVKSKLKEADALSDQRICATDYEQWIAASMRKRMEAIPRSHFWTLVAFFGAPFFAMGFLDNCVFIFSGDVFDHFLWNNFGVSGLFCAGLGGIVAGTVGLQVHGVAARVISKTMKMPETTTAQRLSKNYKTAKHWGGVLGLVFGLCGGMLPLVFLGGREDR